MITELTEEAAQQFLKQQSVARLGCVLETGEPYVVPVNYLIKDGYAYIHSLPGKKLRALESNPKACLEVDEVKTNYQWQSVIAFGEFEEITDLKESAEILQEMFKRFQRLTPVEAVTLNNGEESAITLFRIKINKISGRMEN
jgi:hypothetical protein